MLRKTSFLIMVIVAITLIGGCSSVGGGSSSTSGTSAINIAQVGAYTGDVADGLAGQGIGLQAWVKYTNAHGGIDGHQISLSTADSQSDPTTEVSGIVKLASANPVAFVGMGTFNLQAALPMLKAKKIPVIGGNTSDIVWNSAPNLYAQGTEVAATYLGGFGAHPAGKTKLGLIYCKESSGCTQVYQMLFQQGLARANGDDPVYSAEVSSSAPSYAAQCIAAKQAGVQVLSVALAGATLTSLASQCAQQNFHPTYVFGGTVASDTIAAASQFEGALSGQTNAAWFLTTGVMATVHAAMSKYEPGQPLLSTTVEGWAAGVVFEQAVKNALTGDPGKTLTSADIVKGLSEIKDDTFGGLTPPLTYTASGIQPSVNCYYPIKVVNGKWTAPDGTKTVCPDGNALAKVNAATKALAP